MLLTSSSVTEPGQLSKAHNEHHISYSQSDVLSSLPHSSSRKRASSPSKLPYYLRVSSHVVNDKILQASLKTHAQMFLIINIITKLSLTAGKCAPTLLCQGLFFQGKSKQKASSSEHVWRFHKVREAPPVFLLHPLTFSLNATLMIQDGC